MQSPNPAPTGPMTMHERVVAVLTGKQPDRLPFIDRLELWHKGLIRTGQLPSEFQGMSLTDIHRAVGMGQEQYVTPFGIRLRGTEMITRYEGKVVYQAQDPVVHRFPNLRGGVPDDWPGESITEFITPVGTLTVVHRQLPSLIATGAGAHTHKHALDGDPDYRTVIHILQRAEYVEEFQQVWDLEAELGDIGYAVPSLERLPFQALLIDYFSSEEFFFALHDDRAQIERILTILDELQTDNLRRLAGLQVPYVQFGDNLDGGMTNPRLFREYCLPAYQRYTEILHAQGKKVGSHTDGNMQPLLSLLPECGLDVCESFSPAPLTPLTFDEAWEAWQGRPLMWGAIPSPLLEARVPWQSFSDSIDHLLETVGSRPIILGVGDMVLPINEIERVRTIVARVEAHPL